MDNKYGELEEDVAYWTIVISVSLIVGCGLLGGCAWTMIFVVKWHRERLERKDESKPATTLNPNGILDEKKNNDVKKQQNWR